MIPPADGVYFNTPGVASVRWEQAGRLVLVEWDGWANSTEFAALLDAEIQASGAGLQVGYFARVDEAGEWVAG